MTIGKINNGNTCQGTFITLFTTTKTGQGYYYNDDH